MAIYIECDFCGKKAALDRTEDSISMPTANMGWLTKDAEEGGIYTAMDVCGHECAKEMDNKVDEMIKSLEKDTFNLKESD